MRPVWHHTPLRLCFGELQITGLRGIEGGQGGPAVSLLFAPGERPCRRAVAALADSQPGLHISLKPKNRRDDGRLELVIDGLTFDLSGLAPGREEVGPPQGRSFGMPADPQEALQAIALRLGPHLGGASRMLPVLRSLALVAAQLAALQGTRAVCWHPARCWSTPELFRDTVLGWIKGGPFPALALAALGPTLEGGLQTEGLALFAGQELRIEPELATNRAVAMAIGLQLIQRMTMDGPLQEPDTFEGPDGGPLRIEPSVNGKFARVWRGEPG